MKSAVRFTPALSEEIVDFFSAPGSVECTETVFHPNGEVRQEKTVLEPAPLPTFEAFAAAHGVSTSTLRQWERKHRGFRRACEIARDLQRNTLMQNALLGLYNASFARCAAQSLCGMNAEGIQDDDALPRILDDLA